MDFGPAFANGGPKREPTAQEITNGFPCGPADQTLFNWLHWAPQTEIGNVIELSGQVGSNADPYQLLKAIRREAFNYFADIGAANAITIAPPAAYPLDPVGGMPLKIRLANNITGPATVNVGAPFGTKDLRRADNTPTRAGDGFAGEIIKLLYDPVAQCWQIQNMLTANLPSQGLLVYLSSATLTVPAGVTRLKRCLLWGAGGGGGGANATDASGAGGGGAEYREGGVSGLIPGQALAITVGTGGAGGTAGGGNGQAGGSSSIGAYITAAGGGGGGGRNVPGNSLVGGPPGTGAGGSFAVAGAGGGSGIPVYDGNVAGWFGGQGGTVFQGSPSPLNTFLPGQHGRFPGGGASGAANNGAGGNGANGLVVIEY